MIFSYTGIETLHFKIVTLEPTNFVGENDPKILVFYRKEVHEAFSSPKFASAVFRLFDRDGSGYVWIEDVTANIKEGFQA